MYVNWQPHRGPRDIYPLVQCKPCKPEIVVLDPDETRWRTCFLHWCDSLKKRVPCLLPAKCPYCPMPTSQNTFIPCLHFVWKNGHWVRSILNVTEGYASILDANMADCAFQLRRGERKNSCIRWEIYQLTVQKPVVPKIDIVPSLMRVWGAQNRSDLDQAG